MGGLIENLCTNRIVRLLRENPKVTYDELAEAMGVSRSTVKRVIGRLTNCGYIERVGGKRYGHWEVRD